MIDLGKLQKRQRKIFNPVSEFIESVLNREEGDLFDTYYGYHLEDIEQFKSDLTRCKARFEKHGTAAVGIADQFFSFMSLAETINHLDDAINDCDIWKDSLKIAKEYREDFRDIDRSIAEPKLLQLIESCESALRSFADHEYYTTWQFLLSFGGKWLWWRKKRR